MTNKFRNSKGKIIPYILLIIFAVIVIVPVSWAFLASIKENSEFYGNPWALPQGFHWQNFADAFQKANMGAYFLNSVLVTALALIILLVVAVPAAYVLSRYSFFGKKLINALYMGGLFI